MKAARERILALVSGLPEPKRSRRVLMTLQAFIDDSKTGDTTQPGAVFVLAGYIAEVADWLRFSEDWQRILDMPPTLEFFKMSTFKNEFGLGDERLPLFRQAIEKHVRAAVMITVDFDVYRKFVSPLWKRKDPRRNPYYGMLLDLVIQLKRVMPFLELSGKIEFIFDSQEGEKGRIRDAWSGIKYTRPDIAAHLGNEPKWEKEQEFLPLQAADKLAWWIRRHREETLAGKPPTPFPWQQARQIRQVSWSLDEGTLARIFTPTAGA